MKKKVDLARWVGGLCLVLFSLYAMTDLLAARLVGRLLWEFSLLSVWEAVVAYPIEYLYLLLYFPFLLLGVGLLTNKNRILLIIGAAFSLPMALLIPVLQIPQIFSGIDYIIREFGFESLLSFVNGMISAIVPNIFGNLALVLFVVLMVVLLFWKNGTVPKVLSMVLCWMPAVILCADYLNGSTGSEVLSVINLWYSWETGFYIGQWYDLVHYGPEMILFAVKFAGLLMLARAVAGERICVSGKILRFVGIVGIVWFAAGFGLTVAYSMLIYVLDLLVGYGIHILISMALDLLVIPGIMLIPAAVLPCKAKEKKEKQVQAPIPEEPTQVKPTPVLMSDAYDQLRQLKRMLDEGMITQEDYDKTKKKLFDL